MPLNDNRTAAAVRFWDTEVFEGSSGNRGANRYRGTVAAGP